MKIYDILGNEIMTRAFDNCDKFEISLNGITPGIYSALIFSGGMASAATFVKTE